MALKDRVYWENMGWRKTSLDCSMTHLHLKKQKAWNAHIKKACCQHPHIFDSRWDGHCLQCSTCQPTEYEKNDNKLCHHVPSSDAAGCTGIDSVVSGGWMNGDVSTRVHRNVHDFGAAQPCGCEPSAHIGVECPSPFSGDAMDDAQMGMHSCRGPFPYEDSLFAARPRVESIVGARRSLDSAICTDFQHNLLEQLQGIARLSMDGRPSVNICKDEKGESRPSHKLKRQQVVNPKGMMGRSIASGMYVRIRSSDMPLSLQLRVLQLTKQVLDGQEHLSFMETARILKKGFDKHHGYVWHCVVGASYGSYVTHSVGSSIYFSVGNLAILLFKTSLRISSASP